MNWKKLILIQSAIWGLVGSLFFCWGTIFQSEEEAKWLSETQVGVNRDLFESLLTQKIDYRIGAILIALAFFLQLIAIIWEDLLNRKKIKILTANCIIVVVSLMSIIVGWIFR